MSNTIMFSLADASLRAPIVALSVAAILAAVRLRSPAVRHTLWALVTGAMLTMPLLTWWAPAIAPPFALPILADHESRDSGSQGVRGVPPREPLGNRSVVPAFP